MLEGGTQFITVLDVLEDLDFKFSKCFEDVYNQHGIYCWTRKKEDKIYFGIDIHKGISYAEPQLLLFFNCSKAETEEAMKLFSAEFPQAIFQVQEFDLSSNFYCHSIYHNGMLLEKVEKTLLSQLK